MITNMPRIPAAGTSSQPAVGVVVNDLQQNQQSQQIGLKLAPASIPQFDGTARSYGIFKKFWTENIQDRYTESAQYVHLMSALGTTRGPVWKARSSWTTCDSGVV